MQNIGNPSTSPQELSEELELSKDTICRLLQKFQKHSYLERLKKKKQEYFFIQPQWFLMVFLSSCFCCIYHKSNIVSRADWKKELASDEI